LAPLSVKDCLLIKALQIEKSWAVDGMIVDFGIILGVNFVYIMNLL